MPIFVYSYADQNKKDYPYLYASYSNAEKYFNCIWQSDIQVFENSDMPKVVNSIQDFIATRDKSRALIYDVGLFNETAAPIPLTNQVYLIQLPFPKAEVPKNFEIRFLHFKDYENCYFNSFSEMVDFYKNSKTSDCKKQEFKKTETNESTCMMTNGI